MRRLPMALVLTGCVAGAAGQDTRPALEGGIPPQTFEEMWSGFDPRAEPLEIETLKEWEEDGVLLRVVRYRIGVFKGQKAMMAAVYGVPKGGANLPGLVQIHGGGQYADYRAPLYNAKRGYATISISWAGRINAPGYNVNPEVVKLFWDGKTDDPAYKPTTDWGALDAYHAPCRNPGNAFPGVQPAAWTLDAVESPRNSPWFLCALAARRALTFLEQQPEVDADRLGVYGHSMGGKIAVMTAAADSRVKAAAPSCGGISDRDNTSTLFRATIADDVSLKRISCPIIFLSPANDFHGRINDLAKAVQEISSTEWRLTCSAHHNHQDTEPYQVAGPLWFDQHLKGTFAFPRTPQTALDLAGDAGVPTFTVTPDASRQILSVDIYYTQQGQMDRETDDRENTINRFWHHADAVSDGGSWTAVLPVLSTDAPLWAYANVLYPLDEPVTGAGYYYAPYTAETVNLSSMMHAATPAQLKAAGVRATMAPSLLIETFEGDWEKEWFTYDLSDNWARRTHKIHDAQWKAPPLAKLAFGVRSEQPNKLVLGIDEFAAEIRLAGGPEWEDVLLVPTDFHDARGRPSLDWAHARELRLAPRETLRSGQGAESRELHLGADWKGPDPEFRDLRWVEGGSE
jgi:hypothetical protein